MKTSEFEDEPFAWAVFDGEGSYDLVLYEDNETYDKDWLKRNGPKYKGWGTPLHRLKRDCPTNGQND